MKLTDNPRYRRFVEERDRALEQVLHNALHDQSAILHEALTRTLEVVSRGYNMIPDGGFFTAEATRAIALISSRLDAVYAEATARLVNRWMRLRRNAYALAATAEAEAIGRATAKSPELRLTRSDLDEHMMRRNTQDERLPARVALSLNKLKYAILEALELARVHGETHEDALRRVESVFPKVSRYKRPPRVLKPMREADADPSKPKADASFVFLSDEEWADILDAYKQSELPAFRFFGEPVDVDTGEEELTEWYAWEIEQEMTHDLVASVRDGQNVAAKAAGIKDFVWIAILDDHTDPCCSWRHGLTTREIEVKLEREHADDDCKAIAVPAHFGCRCQQSPVGDVSERDDLDLGSFDDWLSQP